MTDEKETRIIHDMINAAKERIESTPIEDVDEAAVEASMADIEAGKVRPIEGVIEDAKKPYPACPARTRLTMWAKDGSKSYVQRCASQEAEKANENVEASDCLECPVRALLVRDEAKHVPASQRPPKDKRAALTPDKPGNGFLFCTKRLLMEIQPTCGSCSKPVKTRVCGEDKSPYFEGVVTPENCSGCPFRVGEEETES